MHVIYNKKESIVCQQSHFISSIVQLIMRTGQFYNILIKYHNQYSCIDTESNDTHYD